jgi:CO/xanthine dehydrogenase Mo-binding subunit
MEKVTGKAKYAGDIILPGMLHARVLQGSDAFRGHGEGS